MSLGQASCESSSLGWIRAYSEIEESHICLDTSWESGRDSRELGSICLLLSPFHRENDF